MMLCIYLIWVGIDNEMQDRRVLAYALLHAAKGTGLCI